MRVGKSIKILYITSFFSWFREDQLHNDCFPLKIRSLFIKSRVIRLGLYYFIFDNICYCMISSSNIITAFLIQYVPTSLNDEKRVRNCFLCFTLIFYHCCCCDYNSTDFVLKNTMCRGFMYVFGGDILTSCCD